MTIMIMLRSNKGIYHKANLSEVQGYIREYLNIMRLRKYNLKVNRFYIPKANGKLRPIGSPKPSTKMFYCAINIFLSKWLGGKIGNYQHGFRKGKSTGTAGWEIVKAMREGKELYEFDLKSFFNRVCVGKVTHEIAQEIRLLGFWIELASDWTVPKTEHLRVEDGEIKRTGYTLEGMEVYYKTGFTQGSSWSPILCSYALELAGYGSVEGLTMYADDGIIAREGRTEIKGLENEILGIEIAKEKNNGWIEDKFKFLGIEYSRKEGKLTYGLNEISIWDEDEKIKRFLQYGSYKKKKEEKGKAKWIGKVWCWKTPFRTTLVNQYALDGGNILIGETGAAEIDAITFSSWLVTVLLEKTKGMSEWEKKSHRYWPKEDPIEEYMEYRIEDRIGKRVVLFKDDPNYLKEQGFELQEKGWVRVRPAENETGWKRRKTRMWLKLAALFKEVEN